MERKTKLAVCGTGYFSQFHYEAWSRLPVEIVACCSQDAETMNTCASEFSIPARFDDFKTMLHETKPDLVDIITPPPTHVELVTACIENGIPAICQKPFTTSLEDAQKLAQLASKASVPLIVHENFRFQPWYQQIRKLVSDGALGDIFQVTFRLRPGDGQGPNAYLDRQPYFQKMERFLIHETAIHFIDVFRFLLGEVSHVTAELAQLNPHICGEDAGFIMFSFKNGARGLFDGNRLSDHVADNKRLTMGEMTIEGSSAALALSGDGEISIRKFGSDDWQPVAYKWSNTGFGGDCVHNLQAHVLSHLLQGTPLSNTAEQYVKNLQIEEAVYQSHAEGRRISVS